MYLYLARHRDGEHHQTGQVIRLGIHQLSSLPDRLDPYSPSCRDAVFHAFGYHLPFLPFKKITSCWPRTSHIQSLQTLHRIFYP